MVTTTVNNFLIIEHLNRYLVVSLGKAFYGSFPCLIAGLW